MKNRNEGRFSGRPCITSLSVILLALLSLASCSPTLDEWEWIEEAGSLGKVFKLYYDGNGYTSGYLPSASDWHFPGELVSVYPPDYLARTGYCFAGWNTAADGGGSPQEFSVSIPMPSASITLYAKWVYAGIITTIAGLGGSGSSGDDAAATSAQLNGPADVALGPDGSLFIADTYNNKIRKVDTSGIITTVAGTGVQGYAGDGGLATAATLNHPRGLAVDATGAVLIADTSNHRIRKIDSSGIISTIAGTGVQGYSGDGGAATSANLNYPYGVALDSAGAIYFADFGNHRVRKVDSSGTITTVAGTGAYGFSGDGGLATSAKIYSPQGVAVDAAGSLYIVDCDNGRIRKVAGGVISTVVGGGSSYSNGCLATKSYISSGYIANVAVDGAGRIFFSRNSYSQNIISIVDTSGFLTTLAGSGYSGSSGDGGPANAAQLNNPGGIALDSSGNLYIADTSNSRIRKISF